MIVLQSAVACTYMNKTMGRNSFTQLNKTVCIPVVSKLHFICEQTYDYSLNTSHVGDTIGMYEAALLRKY